ncbi:helix-turn-helix transcriptional regulator [Spirosoma pollinicola]|uniref:AraC family transcriptional regulator n=1 Tax=Spirosoma pollinicola TaxID=2057025 RepID=A0A2K8YVI5_9BACT|nr:AraC family transcriptional regulator [Spirosoma pollinicola]AUD01626.1 AraC family transcriptional regulator [Spirosoma pollinicola]
MEVAFTSSPDFNFLTYFSDKFHAPVQGDTLSIPLSLGTGYIRKINLAPDFKLLIHHYTLKEEFVIRRRPALEPYDLISIICHSHDQLVPLSTRERQILLAKNTDFAIQISSTQLDSVIRFPAHTPIYFTVIGIAASRLRSVLQVNEPNATVQAILSSEPGFLAYERLDPAIEKILRQLRDAQSDGALSLFYYQIKVQELVYLVFEKLLRRETKSNGPINKADLVKLLLIRASILADLSKPPHLPSLATFGGLSQTKMKELFRQLFGDSIYDYYQKARLEEAAFLLKHGGHSVAEVGSELGFVNLSHFSRQFEKQYGIKPKRYSVGG